MPRPSDVLPDSSGGLQTPVPARLAHRVEGWEGADRISKALEPLGRPLASGPLGGLLRDRIVGHALHPSLTDVPIGLWSAAAVLDLRNRSGDRDAATLLEGLGVDRHRH